MPASITANTVSTSRITSATMTGITVPAEVAAIGTRVMRHVPERCRVRAGAVSRSRRGAVLAKESDKNDCAQNYDTQTGDEQGHV